MSKTDSPSSAASTSAQSLVLAQEIPVAGGDYAIGVMTLNSPKTMNAVDLAMVNLIDDILAKWRADDRIVAMVMHGAGDRAFCAGGDIRQLYDSMTANDETHLQYADEFFHGEYSKNYRVHLFGKPLIAWGQGFVMGGGLGLYVGASHKVGTETLKLAWPEIRIGLFPDVAGTYYLSRLPFPYGHWMGLSGSLMNAVDCQSLGLIDYCIEHEHFDAMLEGLKQISWQKNRAENNSAVQQMLNGMSEQSMPSMPESKIEPVKDQIADLFSDVQVKVSDQRQKLRKNSTSLADRAESKFQRNKQLLMAIAEKFSQLESDDEWLLQGKDNFLKGCPNTAHVIMNQLKDGRELSLKEVAMYELNLALQSVRHPDFAEGIRAMVVDKDFTPKWQHESVADVPQQWLEEFFQPLHQGDHPFKDL